MQGRRGDKSAVNQIKSLLYFYVNYYLVSKQKDWTDGLCFLFSCSDLLGLSSSLLCQYFLRWQVYGFSLVSNSEPSPSIDQQPLVST